MMADDRERQRQPDNALISAVLTALQQGVQALNNLTQTLKLVFPSS